MRILQFILDTIVPPDPMVRAIEAMSKEDFLGKAGAVAPEGMAPGIASFFPYRNEVVRTALVELKSRRHPKIATLLGAALFDRLLPFADGRPLLVPIPITRKKTRDRGWNQCELLVAAIAACDAGEKFEARTDVLVKVRENEDQVGMGRAERFENLRGCFAVADPEQVRGRNVIVLDDIATTGATLVEARRALEQAGARRIVLASAAH